MRTEEGANHWTWGNGFDRFATFSAWTQAAVAPSRRQIVLNALAHKPGGRVPEPGELFRNPDWAATFQQLLDAESRHRDRLAGLRAAGDAFYREKFRYAQDYDLLLRLLSEGRVLANVADALLQYRLSPGAATSAHAVHQWLFAEKAREFHRQRLDHGGDDYEDWDPREILAFDGAQLQAACEEDPNFGYALLKRLLGVVAERLLATRMQLMDMSAPAYPTTDNEQQFDTRSLPTGVYLVRLEVKSDRGRAVKFYKLGIAR
jgi:hypothetical protein